MQESTTTSVDGSPTAQRRRRDDLWRRVRAVCGCYFDAEGRYDGNAFRTGRERQYDQRVVIELAMALLHGGPADRALAERALRANDLMIGFCAFNMDYALALWHTCAEQLTPATRAWLLERITMGSLTATNLGVRGDTTSVHGQNFTHNGYNLRGMQWHGYNDNHVALGTSALVLGGELTGDAALVEAGRAGLRQLRDLLQRRGFIDECNDCYLPHTLYPLAAIVAWAKDAECRELAQAALVRIWSDLLGHWHPNLGRKIGPSARDYTQGRLSSKGWLMLFSYVFGEHVLPGWLNLDDVFAPEKAPPERRMAWPHDDGPAWNLGFPVSYTHLTLPTKRIV